jgi:hypothetical protein
MLPQTRDPTRAQDLTQSGDVGTSCSIRPKNKAPPSTRFPPRRGAQDATACGAGGFDDLWNQGNQSSLWVRIIVEQPVVAITDSDISVLSRLPASTAPVTTALGPGT